MNPRSLSSLRLLVGEGPVWDQRSNRLLCVDIERHNIHRIDPVTGNSETKSMERQPAALGLCRSGRLIIGKVDGVFLTNFGSEISNKLCNPISDQPFARLNDGKVAPDGSFWVSSMQNNVSSNGEPKDITNDIGGYYRIDAEGNVDQLVPNELGITNTLAWSPDEKYFFYADSVHSKIYRAESNGTDLVNTEIFNSDFDRGVPDGSAMDVEGYLWNCRWGGSCVVRFSPDGRVDQVVEIPATNITSCAFGGADNKTLFVTSAQCGIEADQLARNPLEGAIFAINTPVAGMEVSEFAD